MFEVLKNLKTFPKITTRILNNFITENRVNLGTTF